MHGVLRLHLVAVGLLAGCGGEAGREAAPLPVRLREVQPGSGGPGGVRYSASIVPRAQVDVAFKVNGYVQEIRQLRSADGSMRPMQQGDVAATGMVLARVRDQEYRDQLQRAEANLAKAKASMQKASEDFRRATNLKATNSITGSDYDAATQEYESAKAGVAAADAQVDEARVTLRYAQLEAPMNGVILQRRIEVGTLVGPGSVGFVMADVTSVKAVFGLPDVMLGTVALGRKIGISTASVPGRTFTGTVTAVSPSADQSTRVSEIEVTVPNPGGELRDGMIASLEVPALTTPGSAVPHEAMAIPLAAVVQGKGDSGYAVFVVSPDSAGRGVARLQPVELGQVAGNDIIVTAGLKPGDRIIVTGATIARDGQAVRSLP